VRIKLVLGFRFKRLLFLGIIHLHLTSSLVGVLHVLVGLEVRFYDCALLVGVKISGGRLDLAILFSVPLGVHLRIVFLFVLIRIDSCLFESGSWFESLLFCKSFPEGFILNLQQFASRVDILIMQDSSSKRVDIAKV
jgi:hypothetical protein